MNPWKKAVREAVEKVGAEEVLRAKLFDDIYAVMLVAHRRGTLPAKTVDTIMPLVEEHTRLAVEKALTEQRAAIARAIEAAAPGMDLDEDGSEAGMGAAVAVVRDFGKEHRDVVHG